MCRGYSVRPCTTPCGPASLLSAVQIGVLPICRTLIKSLGSFRSAIELHPQNYSK